MTPKETAIALLSQGLSTSQVASACGVSDSYISQLRSDPEVEAAIASAAVGLTVKDIQFDTRLENAEELALDRIEKTLGFANMGQALAAFRVLNGARRRKDASSVIADNSVTVNVSLTLPAAASARYVVNSHNEIVEVEGKTMSTATPKSLNELLASRAQQTAAAISNQVIASGLNKTANRLDNITSMSPRPPRRLPQALSADLL
jgi:hypothetical protein